MVKTQSKWKKLLSGAISIFVFLVLWQLLVQLTDLGKIMPGPVEVIAKLLDSFVHPIGRYTIFGHILWSLSRSMTGFLLGCLAGIATGLLMARYRLVEAIVRPFTEMIRPIPPIAWISLAILWLGLGEPMKYFIIFIAVFNNMTINVYMGYKSVDQELVGVAQMLGASERQIFRTVILPATVPYIFAGAHIGLATSWAAVVAAEMVRSSEGVGWMVVAGMDVNDIPQILVGVMAIGIVGLSLATLMRWIEAKQCAWNERGV